VPRPEINLAGYGGTGARRIDRPVPRPEINLKDQLVGRSEVVERHKLGSARLDPAPTLGPQMAFVSKIRLARELELRVGGAVVSRLLQKQRGDLLGLEFLRETPGSAISAYDSGQEEACQNNQDAHHAEQLDQRNPCGGPRR